MKRLIYSIIILFALSFASCYTEDILVPTPAEDADRFTFPQGNNSYDNAANEVYREFGVKIIYKDFTDVDFNLSWTNPAIGKIGYDIPQDEEKEAVEYIIDNFFNYLTPEITRGVLNPYFYIADSISQYYVMSSEYGTLEYVIADSYFYDGLDFWAFCWNGIDEWTKFNNELIGSSDAITKPVTSFQKFYRRGVMLKDVYKRAVLRGNIKVPEDFSVGFDFSTPIVYSAALEDDINFYKRRGFPGQMTNLYNFTITQLSNVNRTNPTQNFIDYLHLTMRYEPDSIEILYPEAKFPLIHDKYPIVIDYMKENYNIDPSLIAVKP